MKQAFLFTLFILVSFRLGFGQLSETGFMSVSGVTSDSTLHITDKMYKSVMGGSGRYYVNFTNLVQEDGFIQLGGFVRMGNDSLEWVALTEKIPLAKVSTLVQITPDVSLYIEHLQENGVNFYSFIGWFDNLPFDYPGIRYYSTTTDTGYFTYNVKMTY